MNGVLEYPMERTILVSVLLVVPGMTLIYLAARLMAVAVKLYRTGHVELTRVFSSGQWEFLMSHLGSREPTDHTSRLQFALPFAHATGLRLSELVDATLGRLYTMPVRDGTGVRWMLKVLGKGAKWRAVPIPERILILLAQYLVHRNLDPDPLANPVDRSPMTCRQAVD
jgi:integrase